MRFVHCSMMGLVFSSCLSGKAEDTAVGNAPVDTDTEDSDTETDTEDPDTGEPIDIDGDGFVLSEDCDDRDPSVYPGAEETWNDIDDDCDGLVDADGAYECDMSISATAIYEGDSYSFALTCPFTMERLDGELGISGVCTPDAEDSWAQLLLGATLAFVVESASVSGTEWSGSLELISAPSESSSGWDSFVEGEVIWQNTNVATTTLEKDSVSLDLVGTGEWQQIEQQ